MAYNRYARGTDGKTAYQRQTGRWCKSEVVPFGEKVLFRPLKKSGGRRTSSSKKLCAIDSILRTKRLKILIYLRYSLVIFTERRKNRKLL